MVLNFVLLQIVVALEVLLPTTLYLSVVIALGRMHKDLEMTAIFSCGVRITRVLRPILCLSLAIALLVAGLSMYARPWAYGKILWLKAQARIGFDLTSVKAGHFFETKGGTRVFFVNEIDQQLQLGEQLFVWIDRGDTLRVICAKQAYPDTEKDKDQEYLKLLDGRVYELSRRAAKDRIMKFKEARMHLRPKEMAALEYKIKAAATSHLARSDLKGDVAELQWRFSAPLSTILLALLGVPLSRTSPRQGKYAKLVAAIVIYAVYFNFVAIAKTWVEQEVIPFVPGIWWVHASLAVLLFTLYIRPVRPVR
jgi:lipopolysaccharide export system permease protein